MVLEIALEAEIAMRGFAGHLHTLNLLSVRMYVLLMAVPLEILGQ